MEQHRPRWLSTKFLKKISNEEVNGREIKNIVRVAHALAVSDKCPIQANDIFQGLLSLKNFERDFNEALAKRGLDEDPEASSFKKIKLDDRERYN